METALHDVFTVHSEGSSPSSTASSPDTPQRRRHATSSTSADKLEGSDTIGNLPGHEVFDPKSEELLRRRFWHIFLEWLDILGDELMPDLGVSSSQPPSSPSTPVQLPRSPMRLDSAIRILDDQEALLTHPIWPQHTNPVDQPISDISPTPTLLTQFGDSSSEDPFWQLKGEWLEPHVLQDDFGTATVMMVSSVPAEPDPIAMLHGNVFSSEDGKGLWRLDNSTQGSSSPEEPSDGVDTREHPSALAVPDSPRSSAFDHARLHAELVHAFPPDLHPESTFAEPQQDIWNREFDNVLTEAYNALAMFSSLQADSSTPISLQIRILLGSMSPERRREYFKQLFAAGMRSQILEVISKGILVQEGQGHRCIPWGTDQDEDKDASHTSDSAKEHVKKVTFGGVTKVATVPLSHGLHVHPRWPQQARNPQCSDGEDPYRSLFERGTGSLSWPGGSTVAAVKKMIREESDFNAELQREKLLSRPALPAESGDEYHATEDERKRDGQSTEENKPPGSPFNVGQAMEHFSEPLADSGHAASQMSNISSKPQGRRVSNDSIDSTRSNKSSSSALTASSKSSDKEHIRPLAFGFDGTSNFWKPRNSKSTAIIGLDPDKAFKGGSLRGFQELKVSSLHAEEAFNR